MNFMKYQIIRSKKVFQTGLFLSYNIFDHLTFLFKKEIKYEINILKNLESYLSNCGLIYDIGANIGQYALSLSSLTGYKTKIVCFEPDTVAYSFLNFNININSLLNVSTYNIGVGDANSSITYYKDSKTGSRKGSFIKDFVGNNFQGETQSVEVKNLDTLFLSVGIPDFIKIDVEGYEIEVLKGLKNDNIQNIKFLIETRKTTKEFVFDYFLKLDFKCILFDNELPVNIISLEEIPDFANLFFYYGK